MKILRWMLCHLLSIILIISCVLVFLFRNDLKDDFYQLVGQSPQTAGSVKSSPEMKLPEQPSQQENVYDAAKTPGVAGLKGNKKSTVSKRHSKTIENRKFAGPRDGITPDYRETNPQYNGAGDPWNEVLPETTKLQTSAAPAPDANNVGSEPESNFPPENYDPESIGDESSKIEKGSQSFNATPPSAAISPQIAGQADRVVDEVTTIPDTSEYFRLLENIRQSYWNGDTRPAQAAYEKLMFDYPEYPEAAAELGNIFLQQGDRKAASWAYQNAIPRYLNLHREQEAINLIRFISQHDPAIAESLQKKYW